MEQTDMKQTNVYYNLRSMLLDMYVRDNYRYSVSSEYALIAMEMYLMVKEGKRYE